MTCFSGLPSTSQYRRASLAAVSIASEPPDAKNTTASGMGAIAAIRPASWTVGSVV